MSTDHTKMTKIHLMWLSVGILFWGSTAALIKGLFDKSSSNQIWSDVLLFIFLTFIVTTVAHNWSRRFPTEKPKTWFFWPVISWVGLSIWYFIEKLFGA